MIEILGRILVLALVLPLALGACTQKTSFLLNVDFVPANEHERALAEEKKRGIEEGLSSGSFRRFIFGPRIETLDLVLENAEQLGPLLEARKGSMIGCVAPLRSARARSIQSALSAAGLVCVVPTATDPALRKFPEFFALGPDDIELGRALAQFSVNHLQARRIGVLSQGPVDPSNAEIVRGFMEAAADATVSEVVVSAELDAVEKFRTVRAFVGQSWDVIFVSSYFSDALAAVEEISLSATKETTVLGLESWNNAAFLKDVSPLKIRVFVPQSFRREGVEETVVRVAAHEATKLIVKTEGRVREARSHDGFSGHLSCDGKNCLGALGFYEVKDGKLVPFASLPLR